MEGANIIVIGGGVVGLAIAAELSKREEGVYVLEKNHRIGLETSTHNSGVIHSGIHYPKGSLKANLCVLGNRKIYEICERYGISHRRFGKLTVANGDEEIREIEELRKQGEENGVEGLEIIDPDGIKKMEPNVKADLALYSPSSGIIEPDELMAYYLSTLQANGSAVATGNEVTSIKPMESGYEIRARNGGNEFSIQAKTVINSAGLYADKMASLVGIDVDRLHYRIHLCKGDYFRIHGKPPVSRLVYPVPKGAGLGIHVTPDMSGSVKMGPNAYYVNNINYAVESDVREFRRDVIRYLPSIEGMRIEEDSSGIRPKLQGPGEGFRDFVIREEGEEGFPGFFNLIGIESPGLTASPAIAEYVATLYDDLKR